MTRVRYTTTIQEDILKKARISAAEVDLNANDILEKALELYFKNKTHEIWEKELQSGWIERVTITPEKIFFENIRERTERKNNHLKEFEPVNLKANGWKNRNNVP